MGYVSGEQRGRRQKGVNLFKSRRVRWLMQRTVPRNRGRSPLRRHEIASLFPK